MAAVVAKTNECQWCTKAHSAVAERAYRDPAKVAAVLEDLDTAPIDERLRATLRMLRKLARERTLDASDVKQVLDAGATVPKIKDALAVAFAFNTMGRLADAFGFFQPGPDAFRAGAKALLARGYR